MPKKIVLVGADGSGKTLISRKLNKRLREEGKTTRIIFMGWRNFKNPILKIFSKFYMASKKNKNEKKLARFKPRGWLFYSTYYSELWLRYLASYFSKKDFIIMDRYFFDELAFAKNARFNFFKSITPRPDYTFLLSAPFNIMRKRSHTGDDKALGFFYNRLRNLGKDFRMIEIDTSKPSEKSIEEIMGHLRHKSL